MTDVPPLLAQRRTRCATEDDTQRLATTLAAHPAIENAVLTLHGDLGAGKTTLVRHLLRALGVQGRIKSPTYAVVEPHEVPASPNRPQGLHIWHFDFYRFTDPREWEDAGFRELFAQPGLKLVEWPDKAAGVLPVPDVALTLTTQDDDSRDIAMTAHTLNGQTLLASLAS